MWTSPSNATGKVHVKTPSMQGSLSTFMTQCRTVNIFWQSPQWEDHDLNLTYIKHFLEIKLLTNFKWWICSKGFIVQQLHWCLNFHVWSSIQVTWCLQNLLLKYKDASFIAPTTHIQLISQVRIYPGLRGFLLLRRDETRERKKGREKTSGSGRSKSHYHATIAVNQHHKIN